MPVSVNEGLRQRIQEIAPILRSTAFENADLPIRETLNHTEYQAIVLAIQRIAPHVDRLALESGATWRDVEAWTSSSADDPHRSPAPPRGSYHTRNAKLRPILPRDVEGLYLASLDPSVNHRWRFRGRTPSFGDFQSQLFSEHVLAQYIVTSLASDAAIGLVAAYGADLVGRSCYVAIQRSSGAAAADRGLVTEGTFAFLQYLFDHFSFRKIYFEIPEYNTNLVAGGIASLMVVESRLKDHYYYGERYWDLFTYALYQEDWERVAAPHRGDWPAGHFRDN